MAEDEGFDKVELEDKDKDKRAKDGKEEKEEVGKIVFESETFSSMAWRKCKHFFTNITLEPVMLFYGIVGLVRKFFFELLLRHISFRSIDRVASSQLILDKTCLNDFGFAEDICNDLQNHKANNTVVQVPRSPLH